LRRAEDSNLTPEGVVGLANRGSSIATLLSMRWSFDQPFELRSNDAELGTALGLPRFPVLLALQHVLRHLVACLLVTRERVADLVPAAVLRIVRFCLECFSPLLGVKEARHVKVIASSFRP